MWQQTNLLGRDKLLMQQVNPRRRERKGFILVGQHGIGKTALLEWCKAHPLGKTALISANWSVREILQRICEDWQLEVVNEDGAPVSKSRWQVPWMYNAVLAESGHWLLIDDIQEATPAVLRKLKPLRDRFLFGCAGVPPFRKNELRRMLWGLQQVEVPPLDNHTMSRIAEIAAPIIKTSTPLLDAVHAARGIPAHLLHSLRGEVTPEAVKTEEEEIDISPIFMIVLVLVMALRYVARGYEDSTSMVMMGGLGMAAALIFRFYLFKGMRK